MFFKKLLQNIVIREKQKKIVTPWLDNYYSDLFKKANLRISRERAFILLEFLNASKNLAGDIVELGVFKGSSAYLIANFIKENKLKKKLYLFDSFEGSPKSTDFDNLERQGSYSNTSLGEVENFLSEFSEFVEFKKGFIPETLKNFENECFSFIHIHLNLYKSILDTLNHLYKN